MSTEDTIGHLAEDAAVTDDKFRTEAGLEGHPERAADAATAFPPD